ncbi:MAG: DNA-3-methyladenine glycosylase 2 family protein, partial [Eggerthellaceae bacterium]|nr:DNA-3-methyladenine glycosylase 2 family protein [Eggerthellaceae bacterium]
MARYFEYGDEEVAYLKARDKKLAAAIDAVGHVYREMGEGDLFSGVVHHIVGQQISSAAQATVWARLQQVLGEVVPGTVNAAGIDELQS